MRALLVWGALLLVPGCAISDGGINLNAGSDQTVELANAIDSSGLPMCLREDQEDWSDISD